MQPVLEITQFMVVDGTPLFPSQTINNILHFQLANSKIAESLSVSIHKELWCIQQHCLHSRDRLTLFPLQFF